MEKQNKFNWKVFFTLWLAAIVGTLAVLPYSLTLQASVIEKISATVPLGVFILAQTMQSIVLFGVATAIGMLLAKRIGLGVPILERFFAGEKVADHIKPFLLPTILFGIVVGLVIIGLDKFVFMPALATELIQGGGDKIQTTPWQGFLASESNQDH